MRKKSQALPDIKKASKKAEDIMNKLNDNPVVKHLRMLEKPSPMVNQNNSPSSRFRFGNRSPSMIDESKNKLIPDS